MAVSLGKAKPVTPVQPAQPHPVGGAPAQPVGGAPPPQQPQAPRTPPTHVHAAPPAGRGRPAGDAPRAPHQRRVFEAATANSLGADGAASALADSGCTRSSLAAHVQAMQSFVDRKFESPHRRQTKGLIQQIFVGMSSELPARRPEGALPAESIMLMNSLTSTDGECVPARRRTRTPPPPRSLAAAARTWRGARRMLRNIVLLEDKLRVSS